MSKIKLFEDRKIRTHYNKEEERNMVFFCGGCN